MNQNKKSNDLVKKVFGSILGVYTLTLGTVGFCEYHNAQKSEYNVGVNGGEVAFRGSEPKSVKFDGGSEEHLGNIGSDNVKVNLALEESVKNPRVKFEEIVCGIVDLVDLPKHPSFNNFINVGDTPNTYSQVKYPSLRTFSNEKDFF